MAEGNVSSASNGVENLTAQLRILKKELATLDPNSKRFQELANQAGDVKDRMNDAAEAMNANAGSAFEKLSGNASLLKDRLLNLDFEGVGSSIKSLAGNIRGLSFKDITSGIGGMISALGSLGKAILMNPILLLASVIIGIAMNFEKLKTIVPGLNEAMTGVSDEMNAALETSKKMSEESQKQLDSTLASENSMKLQGMSEREILQLKIAQTQEAIKNLEAQIEAQKVINIAQFEAAKRNKEILQGVIQFLTAPLQMLLYTIDKVGKALGKDFGLQNMVNDWAANLLFDPEEVQNEGLKVIEEQEKTLKALKESKAGYQLSIKAMDKTASDKRKADAQKEADALLKSQEEISAQIIAWQLEDAAAEVAFNAARLKQQEDYYNASQSLVTDAKEMEIDALVADYDARFELANGNAEIEKALAEQQRKDIADIEDKYRKEKEDKDKDAAEKEKARLQSVTDFKIKAIQDSLELISTLTDVFNNGSEKSAKRAFQINKAASIAQTLVTTYLSAQKAYASQITPLDPSSIVRGQIAAGLAIAGGLANVAKIAKTQFNGGGGGGSASGGGGGGSLGSGGGGGSMTSVTPSFNPLNTSFLNNRPSQTGAVQAYVLSSNVSSAMEANQKVKDQTVL
jgi:hypothetical protein